MLLQESFKSLLGNLVSGLSKSKQAKLEAKLRKNKIMCLEKDIEEAKRHWQYAHVYFNTVTEPELVDHAIHMMHAAEVRYGYMLKQLKNII